MRRIIALVGTLIILFLLGQFAITRINGNLDQESERLSSLLKEQERASAHISSDTIKTPKQIFREANYLVKIELWEFKKSPFLNLMIPNHAGHGSGSIIKECGPYNACVLTAWHVTNGKFPTFYAHFKDGTSPQKLELIGGSKKYDFAILKFSDPQFKPKTTATIGKSSALEKGELITALGSSRWGDFWVSACVLHDKPSPPNPQLKFGLYQVNLPAYSNVILIEAKLFKGYSGGPLLNERGELVGIPVATVQLDWNLIGIGIPIDDIMKEAKKILGNSK